MAFMTVRLDEDSSWKVLWKVHDFSILLFHAHQCKKHMVIHHTGYRKNIKQVCQDNTENQDTTFTCALCLTIYHIVLQTK